MEGEEAREMKSKRERVLEIKACERDEWGGIAWKQ